VRPYRQLGQLPAKRHTLFEVDGAHCFEELVGREGFSGQSSLLYHRHLPEAARSITAGPVEDRSPVEEAILLQAHLETPSLDRRGDPVTARQWLLVNEDVALGICLPEHNAEALSVTADADELWFIHEGRGLLESPYGTVGFEAGDYLVVPRGTTSRMVLDDPATARLLILETAGPVDSPHRYRNAHGQLTEAAPYCERDVRGPEALLERTGPASVWVKHRGRFSMVELAHHPFDVVGWDGGLYPSALSIHAFEALAGRVHVPPPFHQTFEAPGVVVCSFVPRLLDWDPEANVLPYHHHNVDSDEVLYYVNGNYQARRGIAEASITHHVGGLIHGPQPGALEASLGRERRTEELAVMVDTFKPLRRTALALQIADPNYPWSWANG